VLVFSIIEKSETYKGRSC